MSNNLELKLIVEEEEEKKKETLDEIFARLNLKLDDIIKHIQLHKTSK